MRKNSTDGNFLQNAFKRPSDAPRKKQFKCAYEALAWHFDGIPKDELTTT